MYQVSNKQMSEIIKYVQAYRNDLLCRATSMKERNTIRTSGNLLKQLTAKQPLSGDLLKVNNKNVLQEK